MGAGVVYTVHDLVTVPIDLVGTALSSSYEPISYYGQASQAAQQAGTPWYAITGQTALNAGTFGVYGLVTTGIEYYQTGDPTAFQQTAGPFVVSVGLGYYIQTQTSPEYRPTYNLGGTGEVPGAVNVQPPGAPVPPDPALIAPSAELPIAPNSGNVVINNSPIAPEGGLFGPGYQPAQIVQIASEGGTITVTTGVEVPGVPSAGQQALISAAPPGSQITVAPSGPFSTVVTITTPTPWYVPLLPYPPIMSVNAVTPTD